MERNALWGIIKLGLLRILFVILCLIALYALWKFLYGYQA